MKQVVAVEGGEGTSGRRSALKVVGVDLCTVVFKVFSRFFF